MQPVIAGLGNREKLVFKAERDCRRVASRWKSGRNERYGH